MVYPRYLRQRSNQQRPEKPRQTLENVLPPQRRQSTRKVLVACAEHATELRYGRIGLGRGLLASIDTSEEHPQQVNDR
jgi:hypothetical protein